MKYQPVARSHVVPAGYLRAWSCQERIGARRVGKNRSIAIGVRDAGVRKHFYRRERPQTGETIHDVEWSLSQLEGVALPVVATLAQRWPIGPEDKGKVGQFIATQHVRGPAFKSWHERFVQPVADDLRADPARYAAPSSGMTAEEAVERAIELMSGNSWRTLRMLSLVRSVSIAFTSMHWTLVEFSKRRLITSDHPVVVWPLDRSNSLPQPNNLNAGVLDTLEVFVPMGPSHLLLMTWVDEVDPDTTVGGYGRHIGTANAFVAANADQQWFHEPGVEPWRLPRGARRPLSADLIAGYDVDVARRSSRRRQASSLANAQAGAPPTSGPISVVNVTRPSSRGP